MPQSPAVPPHRREHQLRSRGAGGGGGGGGTILGCSGRRNATAPPFLLGKVLLRHMSWLVAKGPFEVLESAALRLVATQADLLRQGLGLMWCRGAGWYSSKGCVILGCFVRGLAVCGCDARAVKTHSLIRARALGNS